MPYTADEKGRWMERWEAVHRVPPAARLGMSSEERAVVAALEASIADGLGVIFGDSGIGRGALDVMKGATPQSDDWADASWSLRFTSTFVGLARSVFELRVPFGPGSPVLKRFLEDFAPRCEPCMGSGIPILGPFSGMPSAAELKAAALTAPSALPADKLNGLVPASVLESLQPLCNAMMAMSGRGEMDFIARRVDDTLFSLPNKHLVDYRLWIQSRHERAGIPVALFGLGEFSGRGGHWALGAGSAPCPACGGDGAVR